MQKPHAKKWDELNEVDAELALVRDVSCYPMATQYLTNISLIRIEILKHVVLFNNIFRELKRSRARRHMFSHPK